QPLATLVLECKIQPRGTVRVMLTENHDSLTFESANTGRAEIDSVPTVLIVDDNRDFLRLLSLELTDATKWRVITAQSVAEAEVLSAAQAIDFGLFDLLLPDGNGLELGTKLRERQPRIRVAIMTGAELTTKEEGECHKYEFHVVNKPFLPQQIISLV